MTSLVVYHINGLMCLTDNERCLSHSVILGYSMIATHTTIPGSPAVDEIERDIDSEFILMLMVVVLYFFLIQTVYLNAVVVLTNIIFCQLYEKKC